MTRKPRKTNTRKPDTTDEALTPDQEYQSFEYRMLAADGKVVWLRDIVSVRRRDDGPCLWLPTRRRLVQERQQSFRPGMKGGGTQQFAVRRRDIDALSRLLYGRVPAIALLCDLPEKCAVGILPTMQIPLIARVGHKRRFQ